MRQNVLQVRKNAFVQLAEILRSVMDIRSHHGVKSRRKKRCWTRSKKTLFFDVHYRDVPANDLVSEGDPKGGQKTSEYQISCCFQDEDRSRPAAEPMPIRENYSDLFRVIGG